MIACGHFNADIGLANVRPEHRAFYRKVFLQEPLGEPRLFPGPDQAGRADGRAIIPTIRDQVFQRFPFMRSSAFERRMLFERSRRALARRSGVVLVRAYLDGAELLNRSDVPRPAPNGRFAADRRFAEPHLEQPDRLERSANRAISARTALAFTVAPHLQPINHRGCFSPFVGI